MQPESVSTTYAGSETEAPSSDTANRKGFRFGLKWLFLLIAILCAALGAYAFLERQSREMLARHQAILAAIQEEITTAPPGVRFVAPKAVQRSKDEIAKRRTSANPRRRPASRIFGRRSLATTDTYNVQLDATNPLADPNAKHIALNLAESYGKVWAKVGLKRNVTITGPGPNTATVIWQIPEHGVSVLVDVTLDPATKRADVRVIFIQNESI